jgi:hypothetical protein
MKKMVQICQIFKKNQKPIMPDFYDKFHKVAKNIERFWFFSTFISSM